MSRYIPPALRKQQEAQGQAQAQSSTTNTPPSETPSSSLQPRRLSDLKLPHPIPGLDAHDIHDYFRKGADDVFLGVQSTLNATAAAPHQLGYLMLFSGANPRWDEDKIIFAKTKIDLLPGYEAAFANTAKPDSTVAASSTLIQQSSTQDSIPFAAPSLAVPSDVSNHPIAVFEQSHVSYSQQAKGFKFAGWFSIESVDFLHPESDALARMLEQKWRGKKREGEAWKRSFGQRWAVLKMRRVEVQGEAPDVRARDGEGNTG